MTHSDEQSLEGELAEAKSELAALRVENARLRGLLGLDDRATAAPKSAWNPTLFTPAESTVPVVVAVDRTSPAAAKIALFRSLFVGRDDLAGGFHAGLYPLVRGDSCRLLACDFDGPGWAADALAYLDAAHAEGIPAALERSRSGTAATSGCSSPGRSRPPRRDGSGFTCSARR